MSSSLNPIYKATAKIPRRLPDGTKEILQDFVVAVLRGKISKERFPQFAAEWFQKLYETTQAKTTKAETHSADHESDGSRKQAAKVSAHNVAVHEDPHTADDHLPDEQPAHEDPYTADAHPPTEQLTIPHTIEEPSASNIRISASNAQDHITHPHALSGDQSTVHVASESSKEPPVPEIQADSHFSAPPPPEDKVEALNPNVVEPEKSTLNFPDSNVPNPAVSTIELPPTVEAVPSTSPRATFDEHRGSAARRQGISAESYDPSVPNEQPETAKHFPKTDKQLSRVKEAVHDVLLFRSVEEEQLLKIIDSLEEIHVDAGQDVITVGDEVADYFYIIESGDFDCFGPDNVKLHEYNGKGYFGELALMYNQPRAATVRGKTDGQLWRLDRETFKKIVVRGAYEKRQLYMSLLEKVDFIADLQPYEKQNVCDALSGKTYAAGDVVMRQGDVGDGMYFVEEGEVVCTRSDNDGTEAKEIGRAGPGQYVGELALITDQPRAATVVAAADGTKLAFLDSQAFERLMGPCLNILKKNTDRYRDRMVAAFGENYAQFLK